ncbi:hypothetical protein HPP92_024452 [Vanilla planifolia]|uniref:Uncharacterized protein n=1 Tax=Vanilla planifolia TaxID=51239 RepID=A0A835PMI2_VANPL|nr:hypothetical protein HPP92_024452 [Vanilla planifolia]
MIISPTGGAALPKAWSPPEKEDVSISTSLSGKRGCTIHAPDPESNQSFRTTRVLQPDYSANVPEDFCANPDDSCGLFRVYDKLSSKSYLFPFKA